MDTTLLTVFGALVVALVASRSSSNIAAADRCWELRRDLYMEVVVWLEDDVDALRDREPHRASPLDRETRIGLHAIASSELEDRLLAYQRARTRALGDLESSWRIATLFWRMKMIHQQIKVELGAPVGITTRLAFAVFGSSLPTSLMTLGVALLVRRRWRAQVLYPPTS